MALTESKKKLEKSIADAFEKVLTIAKQDTQKDVSADIRKSLAKDISQAIHEYVISAQVDISSVQTIVPAGIAVSAAGTPVATGATTAPATATHTGVGALK